MIISDVKNDVVASGVVSRTMTVKADATSLALELENLYTNPHKAIVRELTSNAVDSHNKISNKESYWIQVPSLLNPVFKIRDFGTGLTPEEVDEYLNRLYSGTKRESNDQIGGFGLGAKSPFALVDTITLMSYKDGKVHEYLWYKDAEGIPTMVIQDTRDTEEPNGILYVVPLEDKDVLAVSSACATETFTFEIIPRFFKDIEDLESEYDLIGESHYKRIFDSKSCAVFEYPRNNYNGYYYNRGYFQGISLSVGGVHYLLPTNVQRVFQLDQTFASVFNFNDYQFVIKLPIGLIKLPKNRETILETTSNRDVILEYIKEATSNYIQSYIIDDFVDTLKTTFITGYEQLFVMLHQYALDKGVYLSCILDLFKEYLGVFSPSGIFKDLTVDTPVKPLSYLACQYTYNPYANSHPSYVTNVGFFVLKGVCSETYKTDPKRSNYLSDLTRTHYKRDEKILFVFTGSSKFMGANLKTIEGIEDYTRIVRIDISSEIKTEKKENFYRILELMIPLYFPNATLKLFKDIAVAPRSSVRRSVSANPILNIRYVNLDNFTTPQISYTTAEKMFYVLDEEENKVPLGLSYFPDEKILYIKREDFNPSYYGSYLYRYYVSLGYTKFYLVNESMLETFKEFFVGSSKTVSNFANHEGLYDFSNIDVETLEQYWHYMNIVDSSVLKQTYDYLCERFSEDLSKLNWKGSYWKGIPSQVLPDSLNMVFRLLDSFKIKEKILEYNFPNIFDQLSKEDLINLLQESLAPSLFSKVTLKEDIPNA